MTMKTQIVISTMTALYEMLVGAGGRELTPFEYRKEGIYFKVQVSVEATGYELDDRTHHPEWEGSCTKMFHAILLKGHMVFINVTDVHGFTTDIPQTGWKNTSNHDSCWRYGLDELTGIAFECWDTAFAKTPEEHRVLPKDAPLWLRSVPMFAKPFKFVEVEHEPDYEIDNSGYHRKITKVTEIERYLTKEEVA